MAMYDNLLANVPTDLWIGGKWCKSSDGARFDVIDPATEKTIWMRRSPGPASSRTDSNSVSAKIRGRDIPSQRTTRATSRASGERAGPHGDGEAGRAEEPEQSHANAVVFLVIADVVRPDGVGSIGRQEGLGVLRHFATGLPVCGS